MNKSLLNSTISALVCFGLTAPGCFAQTYNGHQLQSYNGQQLQGHVTFVPAGSNLDAALTSPIDSSVAKPGDLFSAKLYAPMYVGSDMVLPANTVLEGQIVAADKSGFLGANGKMALRLTGAVTPDGMRFPLSATIATTQGKGVENDKDGNLHGRSKKASIGSGAARTAAWTAGGTLLGICFAPIVAGSVAAGAIAGVATGGGVGLASNLWRKGKDVKMASGTRIQFTLDQPMSLSTNVAGANSYMR